MALRIILLWWPSALANTNFFCNTKVAGLGKIFIQQNTVGRILNAQLIKTILYKPDCDSNDCKLPNEKAIPSILAIDVWLVKLHVVWAINYTTWATVALGWVLQGSQLAWRIKEDSFLMIDSMQVDRTCVRSRMCAYLRLRAHVLEQKGCGHMYYYSLHIILFPAFLHLI